MRWSSRPESTATMRGLAALALTCAAACTDVSERPATDVGPVPDLSTVLDAGLATDVPTDGGAEAIPDQGDRIEPACAPPVRDGGPPDGFDAGRPRVDLTEPGAFAVGVTTVQLEDAGRGRRLSVEVWYPADDLASSGAVYRVEVGTGPSAAICGRAARDAMPRRTGPFPIVLVSHGSGGSRYETASLSEHVASYGFVVAAVDHGGDTLADLGSVGSGEGRPSAQALTDRPLDLSAVLDWIPDLTVSGTRLPIDLDRVASLGTFAGASTALDVAERDGRVGVVVAIALEPGAAFSPERTAELGLPLLIFGGSADMLGPVEEVARPAFESAARPKALAIIADAGHYDFSDYCGLDGVELAVRDGCDPTVDRVAIHDRLHLLTVAFLERYLSGVTSFDWFLEPGTVEMVGGIEYERAR